MAFFKIFVEQLIRDTFPQKEREKTENVKAATGLMKGVEYTNGFFERAKVGADIATSPASLWSAGSYPIGEVVYYDIDGAVYVCTKATTAVPGSSTDWKKVQDCFIGADEIVQFNGLKLALEYALNRRFFTSFNQPPTASDIYIDTFTTNPLVFVAGGATPYPSAVFSVASSAVAFAINSNTFTTSIDFRINVPAGTFGILGPDAEKIIRNFIDPFVTFGTKYIIEQY